jgi:hypothetical protein
MPKKIEEWGCEICGTIWHSEEDAKKCEESHCKIDFMKAKYDVEQSHYPDAIVVKFADGKIRYYTQE